MHTSRRSRRVAAAPAAPQTRKCATIGRAGHTRLGTRPSVGGGRCPDIKGVARVCTMNLHAILRSGSELVSLSDRILLLVACRPRAHVIRACAVSIARRGAQKGRLGAPCKAGRALVRTQHYRCTACDMSPPSLGARRPLGGFTTKGSGAASADPEGTFAHNKRRCKMLF